jgi:hypothetical protein
MRQGTNVLRVELVFDRDCPNVGRARDMIRAALREVGASAVWEEWDRADAATPADLRSYGSPSVFVNGKDVSCDANEAVRSDANSCRVYTDECGCVSGAPSAGLIVRAIRIAQAA